MFCDIDEQLRFQELLKDVFGCHVDQGLQERMG